MTKQKKQQNSNKKTQKIQKKVIEKKYTERSSKERDQEKTNKIITQENFNTIDMTILKFFDKIQQTDLVFEKNIRQKLRELYPGKNIKPQQTFKDTEQKQKIKKYVQKLLIVEHLNKNPHQNNTKLIQKLEKFFFETSKFFPSQVTPQVYSILTSVCDIVFEWRKDGVKRRQKLREFGDSIPNIKNKEKFFYFGFNIFYLPEGKTQGDIERLKKHHPQMKYVLLNKYRQADGPFADFTQQMGAFVMDIVRESELIS